MGIFNFMAASPKSATWKKFSGEKTGDWRIKNSNTFKPTANDSYTSAVGLYELAKGGGVVRKLFTNNNNFTVGQNQQRKQAQGHDQVVQTDLQPTKEASMQSANRREGRIQFWKKDIYNQRKRRF